jgi:hypothetical protein
VVVHLVRLERAPDAGKVELARARRRVAAAAAAAVDVAAAGRASSRFHWRGIRSREAAAGPR